MLRSVVYVRMCVCASHASKVYCSCALGVQGTKYAAEGTPEYQALRETVDGITFDGLRAVCVEKLGADLTGIATSQAMKKKLISKVC